MSRLNEIRARLLTTAHGDDAAPYDEDWHDADVEWLLARGKALAAALAFIVVHYEDYVDQNVGGQAAIKQARVALAAWREETKP